MSLCLLCSRKFPSPGLHPHSVAAHQILTMNMLSGAAAVCITAALQQCRRPFRTEARRAGFTDLALVTGASVTDGRAGANWASVALHVHCCRLATALTAASGRDGPLGDWPSGGSGGRD